MMINISDIKNAQLLKSEKFEFIANSEDCLKELSEHEKINIGGGHCPIHIVYYYGY